MPDEVLLQELLDRIADTLGTDTAAFLLLDEAGESLVATAAKGIEEEVEQGVRIPVGRGFAGRIAAERRAIFIEDVDHADIVNPILREKRIRSMLGVPLLVEGNVIGVLHVGTLVPRLFDAATPSCCSPPPTVPRPRSSARGCSTSAAWWRCSSAASCRRRCRPCPAWSWRRATSRPCGAAGSAATGTTRSRSAGAGSRWSSAT